MKNLLPVMKNILTVIPLLLACGLSAQESKLDPERTAEYRIYDEEFTEVIDPYYATRQLASGHDWTEGPLWLEDEGILIYNDVPRNTTYAWEPSTGTYVYLSPSGYTGKEAFTGREPGANGMALDASGNLILCHHGDRRIARMKAPIGKPSSTFETIADKYNGKRFNSPNDLTIHSSGAIFFTDPPYGLPGQMEDPGKEIPFQGVYRIDPDGTVVLLTSEFSRPNGIAFSPDESKLYVANSDPGQAYWKVFDVLPDLTLANGRVMHDATEMISKFPGLPDGMETDSKGYIYASGPGGIYVFAPNEKLLGIILTGQPTSNCALSSNEDFLYITADAYILQVKLMER